MVTTIMPREDELKGWLCVKEKIFDNLFTAAPRTPLAILALGNTCFFMSVSRLTRSPARLRPEYQKWHCTQISRRR